MNLVRDIHMFAISILLFLFYSFITRTLLIQLVVSCLEKNNPVTCMEIHLETCGSSSRKLFTIKAGYFLFLTLNQQIRAWQYLYACCHRGCSAWGVGYQFPSLLMFFISIIYMHSFFFYQNLPESQFYDHHRIKQFLKILEWRVELDFLFFRKRHSIMS